MIFNNIYYVYTHTTEDGIVFYVGEGKLDRYKSRSHRPEEWYNIVKANPNFVISIIKDNLTKEEAEDLERELIIKYGRSINNTGTLVNKSIGFGCTGLKYELNKVSLPVYQLDIKGNILKEFNSATEITDLLGYDNSVIAKCCNKVYNLSYGYQWCYKKDYTKPSDYLYKDSRSPAIVSLLEKGNKYIITRAYNNSKEAERFGLRSDGINKCLNKKRLRHGGYYWKYLKDVSIDNQKRLIINFKIYNI